MLENRSAQTCSRSLQSWARSDVMFKTQTAVFYWDLKPRGAAEWF